MKSVLSTLLCTAVLSLFSGCETSGTQDRIQEKSTVFAQLTPEQKKNIEARIIEINYTTDMVYMALGRPAKRVTKETPDGQVEMWTYRNFFAPQGFATVGDSSQQYRADLAERGPGVAVQHAVGSQKSIASTRGGPQANLYLPEPVSDTLYVQFFQGRVFSIKLDSESN